MILAWAYLVAALGLALLLLVDLLGMRVQPPVWASSRRPWGWWMATLGPRAWVATLPPEVGPRARRWMVWLLRLLMACGTLNLLSVACAEWRLGFRWIAGAGGVAQKVTGVGLLSLVLLLVASGIQAGLQKTGPRK